MSRRRGIATAATNRRLSVRRTDTFHSFDDDKIDLHVRARGMSTREIQGHLEEIYKVEVSPTLISNVTEAVMEEVKSWQSRALDSVYPIVYLDALMVKIRGENGLTSATKRSTW